ncbi:AraC family transcriptional regulator [Streptomyces sp. NBC_00829]|uniref:AraC family transcriptional regulator n=1 Tax=Streptomyces sp. NBC_00829 TaxID=2903679 RepID=UPI003870E64F|nr:AraC family transcriptional regulator [Streptomyces sp. NBC_00829]
MTELARAGATIPLLNTVRLGVTLAGQRIEFLDWGFYPPEPWRNYWHSHSYYELCYAYTGRGTFRTAVQEYPVGTGELFVARPGDIHEITTDALDPLGIVFWSWTMVPERGPRGTRPDSSDTLALLDAFATGPRQVVPAAATPLPRLLATLAEEAATQGPGSTDLLTALGSALILGSARAIADHSAAPHPVPPPGGRAAAAVARMTRYLDDNFDRPVRVRDVAAQVHLSERHAARLFHQAAGFTINAYLTRYRLGVAAQRLADPALRSLSVAAIARSCGYSDARHFSTVFRRHWGALPTQVRAGNGTTHLVGADVPPMSMALKYGLSAHPDVPLSVDKWNSTGSSSSGALSTTSARSEPLAGRHY